MTLLCLKGTPGLQEEDKAEVRNNIVHAVVR